MTIYRGAGGGGDATSDIELNAITALTVEAAASANSAAAGAASASTSASSASGYLASTAASAAAAAASATSAGSYAGIATTQAGNAATSASTASTQATLATTQATNAANSATAAASSASSASTSATAASSSASGAATSASNASASASSASTSATTATTQASNAASSASAAATSAANAALSEINAAASVIASASSASSSSISASSAASSAAASSTSAASAASSAASATAIVTGVASTRASVRPSLLLDFANTRTLDPRVTFSRAGTATFYDNKSTAVAEQNLLTYSQEFDNALWVKSNSAVTATTGTAPDNTTTADTIATTAGLSSHTIQQTITLPTGSNVFSTYLKAGTNNYAQLTFAGTTNYANFDLSTGVTGTSSGVVSSIVSIGNGWYRCVVIFTKSTETSCIIALASTASDTYLQAWLALGTETILSWGAQLELRSAATAYIPTTTQTITNYISVLQTANTEVARFDCNPVTRESLGLLIEESRTNLLTYSADITQSAWTKGNTVVFSNQLIAPDGTISADIVAANTVSTAHSIQQGFSAVSGTNYTGSIFVKRHTGPQFVRLVISGATSISTYFDLSALTFSNTTAGGTVGYTSVGNGWYRVWLTRAADDTASRLFIVYNYATIGAAYIGDSFDGHAYWGGQLEVGAFPTSYVPTVSAQVTRAADSFTMSGTNFSSWYNQAEGTLSVTATCKGIVSDSTLYAIDDGTTGQTNVIDARYTTFGVALRPRVRAAGVTEADIASSVFTFGTPQQFSFAYKVNDFAASQTGGAALTDTAGVLPIGSMTRLRLGARGTGIPLTQLYISRFVYYPVRLSNTEIQGITS